MEVLRKVRALQKLTAQTGTITRRSQGLLLQALSPEELISAAQILTEGMTENDTHKQQWPADCANSRPAYQGIEHNHTTAQESSRQGVRDAEL
jgi:hypothetical protein